MTHIQPNTSSLKQVDDPDKLRAILEAVSSLTFDDVMTGEVADELNALSSITEFEGIEATPDGVFWVDGPKEFEAVSTIYVTLHYGGKRDATSMSDSYPAYIRGHVNENNVIIDSINVDTSSFFE